MPTVMYITKFDNLYHHSSLKSSYDCQRIMSELCIFCNLSVSGRRHVVVCDVFGKKKQHRLCGDTGILFIYFYLHVRGESKKFVDFVNKSTYAISLKLPYVCDQFNTNKHRKFQSNRLIKVVSMAICLMRVSATRSTPRR